MTEYDKKTTTALEWACVVLAWWFIISFIWVALSSISYPFNLEWMEGQNIDVVQRVVHGLPVYTEPSLDYVPFIYTPLYYYVSALVALITGVGFFPARLVSFLSALGIGAVIFEWIRKEGGKWQTAFIAAGLFFATYKQSGRWFDIGRVDSLFLFLTLAGLFVFYHYRDRGRKASLASALLLVAAFFTKQPALVIAIPMLIAGFWLAPRHALWTAGFLTAALVVLITTANLVSSGWFNFFVFTVPAGHAVRSKMFTAFWNEDMVPVSILMGLAIISIALCWQVDKRKSLCYLAFLAGCFVTAYTGRLHEFGYANVLMPVHAGLALVCGIGLMQALRYDRPTQQILSVLTMVQMLLLLYDPNPLIPSAASVRQGNEFLGEIAQIQGDIFMPDLQFIQARAGKKSFDFGMPAYDIMRSKFDDKNDIKKKLLQELKDAFQKKRFTAVIPGQLIFNKLPEMQGIYTLQKYWYYPEGYAMDSANVREARVFMVPSESAASSGGSDGHE